MDEKRTPLTNDIPKYKKKSLAKGTPRSKHKHQYETVLLVSYFSHTDLHTGAKITTEYLSPTKVCMVCGRIGDRDNDPSYYIDTSPRLLCFKGLSEKALALPKWYIEDFLDKFAKIKD